MKRIIATLVVLLLITPTLAGWHVGYTGSQPTDITEVTIEQPTLEQTLRMTESVAAYLRSCQEMCGRQCNYGVAVSIQMQNNPQGGQHCLYTCPTWSLGAFGTIGGESGTYDCNRIGGDGGAEKCDIWHQECDGLLPLCFGLVPPCVGHPQCCGDPGP